MNTPHIPQQRRALHPHIYNPNGHRHPEGVNHKPNSKVPKLANHASRVQREERTSLVSCGEEVVEVKGRDWVESSKVPVGGDSSGSISGKTQRALAFCHACDKPFVHDSHPSKTFRTYCPRRPSTRKWEESGHCSKHTYNTIRAGSCAGLVHGTASGNGAASRVACTSLLVVNELGDVIVRYGRRGWGIRGWMGGLALGCSWRRRREGRKRKFGRGQRVDIGRGGEEQSPHWDAKESAMKWPWREKRRAGWTTKPLARCGWAYARTYHRRCSWGESRRVKDEREGWTRYRGLGARRSGNCERREGDDQGDDQGAEREPVQV
ncbi:hypothetical protein BD779DRAFT_1476603 [Infundibulicybe gibba]|nr:hypothetical protein BD779DRAFT_1476603 [Infundibulicybe gibba]